MKKYVLLLLALFLSVNMSAIVVGTRNEMRIVAGNPSVLYKDTTALLELDNINKSCKGSIHLDNISKVNQVKVLSEMKDSLVTSFNRNSHGLKLMTDSTSTCKYKVILHIARLAEGRLYSGEGCFPTFIRHCTLSGFITVLDAQTGEVKMTVKIGNFQNKESYNIPHDNYVSCFKELGEQLIRIQ